MASPYKLTQEHQLKALYPDEIAQHWQTGHFANFTSFDNLTIEYALFISAENDQCIVLSPGRAEAYLKYKELAFDLHNQGYNVAIIDHRGQGLSSRELIDKHKGYVRDFNDYVLDFEQFVSKIVKPKCNSNMYVLAHSMGSAIAIRHMQQFPDTFAAASLSSPMIAVNGGDIPDWLGKPVVGVSHWVNDLFSEQSAYFYGYGPYKEKSFVGNDLTQSKIRYQLFKQEYVNNPQLQLGGVTFSWLQQAIANEAIIFADINKLTTPILVFQAEKDTVVSNVKQTLFCQQLHQLQPQSCPTGKPLVIKDALHELLFEGDDIRQQSLSAMLDWFNSHP